MEPVNDLSEIDSYTPKSMREVLASMNVRLPPEASKQNDPLLRFISSLHEDTFSTLCDLMKTYGVLSSKRKRKQRLNVQDQAKRFKADQPNSNGAGESAGIVIILNRIHDHRRTRSSFFMYTTHGGSSLPN